MSVCSVSGIVSDSLSASAESKRQSSTRVACSENSAKLTPTPSQVAPSGYGDPGQTLIDRLRTTELGITKRGVAGMRYSESRAARSPRARCAPPLGPYLRQCVPHPGYANHVRARSDPWADSRAGRHALSRSLVVLPLAPAPPPCSESRPGPAAV